MDLSPLVTELIRLTRNGVQALVGMTVSFVVAWLTTKGFTVTADVDQTVLAIMGVITPVVTWCVSALVAQVEKKIAAIGVLNGPRLDLTYTAKPPVLEYEDPGAEAA